MPPRPVPTARQLRLGAELRKLRERAGLTAREAGEMLSANQARISNIETGRFGLSAQRVRTLARNYNCADEALVDALVGMTGERKRGWWEEYRETFPVSLLDLAELEHHALRLRVTTAVHIPGLLQTVDHARALFRAVVPPLSPPEMEHRISYRIKRQQVLYREQPVPYTAIIHEAALRMGFGGPDTSRAQLEHLIETSERDNVSVLVVPFDAVTFPGTGQGTDHAYGPVPQLDTIVLETHHGCEFLDAEAQLDKYRTVLDRTEASALKPTESRDFIHRIARSL